MSASLAAVTLCNANVPLLPSFRMEDVCTMKVEHNWTTGNGANTITHSHKMHFQMCDDLSNKELLLCIVDECTPSNSGSWRSLVCKCWSCWTTTCPRQSWSSLRQWSTSGIFLLRSSQIFWETQTDGGDDEDSIGIKACCNLAVDLKGRNPIDDLGMWGNPERNGRREPMHMLAWRSW